MKADFKNKSKFSSAHHVELMKCSYINNCIIIVIRKYKEIALSFHAFRAEILLSYLLLYLDFVIICSDISGSDVCILLSQG